MKHQKHSICIDRQTTPAQVVQWAQALMHLCARIAPRFARPEPRRRVHSYLQGLLSDTPRKNGWQLAEQAREATPYGMQRLLSSAVWDVDGVRDDVRSYVLEHLGHEGAVVVIDETSFPKCGKKSAGVQEQYCGTTGQVENCQVGVFLDSVTALGHALIDRELYLPLSWTENPERCREAGIPETIRFQTKCELAMTMLARIFQEQLSVSWVVADTVYGSNLDLRNWLQTRQCPYVLAVACDEPVGLLTRDGQRRRMQVRDVESYFLEEQDWQRLSMSQGTKGPRLFDWAVVPLLHQWENDERHWLLIRRFVETPHEKTYYLVFAPEGTTLQEMVNAIGKRWHIEVDFENAKDLGLDHYEVRHWTGWYRHITLCLLAHAFLIGICQADKTSEMPFQASPEAPPLLPLTVPEVRHLLGRLMWPASASMKLVLAWSWWRRWHRSRASYFHTKRRLKAG